MLSVSAEFFFRDRGVLFEGAGPLTLLRDARSTDDLPPIHPPVVDEGGYCMLAV